MAIEHEQDLAERLLGERLERPLLVRRLAAVAERQLEREHGDDAVDHAAGGETRAGEPLEAVRARDPFALLLAHLGRSLHAHRVSPIPWRGTQSVSASGSTLTLNDLTFDRSPPSSS